MPRVAAVRVADACERCAGSHAASLTQRDTTRFGSAVGERFSGDFRVAGSQSQSLPSLVAGMEGAADVAVAEVPLDDADADAEAGATGQHSPEPKLLDLDKAARRKDANRISAKKSRERKAQSMEMVKKENEDLRAEVAALKAQLAALQGHHAPHAQHVAVDAHAAYEHEGGLDDAALPIKKQKR